MIIVQKTFTEIQATFKLDIFKFNLIWALEKLNNNNYFLIHPNRNRTLGIIMISFLLPLTISTHIAVMIIVY